MGAKYVFNPLTGNLDTTDVVAFNGEVNLGTAAAPSVFFTGDLNTGIYSPGADQVAISTNGTERVAFGTSEVVFNDGGENYDFRIEGDTNSSLFFVDASAEAVGIGTPSTIKTLTVAGDVLATALASNGNLEFNCDDNANNAGSDAIIFKERGNERMRMDGSGRLLVGTSSASTVTHNSSAGTFDIQPILQVNSTGATTVFISSSRAAIDDSGPQLAFARQGSTDGSIIPGGVNTVLGAIQFFGGDGNDLRSAGGRISCEVDGTPGANDMPGRLVFSVTADGSASPTEALRISNDRYVRLASGSGGIQFNGDTAAANALDDYEEGTWTPDYQTSNSDISITSTTVSHAVYTKIGNRVFCTCRFYSDVSSVGTGTVRVTGLPFSTASTQIDVSCNISISVRFTTAAPVTAAVRGSATELDLITVFTNTTSGGNATYMPAANLKTGGNYNIISMSFNYIV